MSISLNCSRYNVPTAEEFTKAQIATILLDVVVCLVYIVTVAFIIFLGTYQRFLSRLLLYLIVVILFYTICDAIKMAAFQDEFDVHGTLQLRESVCTAMAFVSQVFLWLTQLIFCGMTFHIFTLSVCQKDMHTRRCEIIAIAAALTVTLLVSVVPFIPIQGSTAYGWSEGFTCWIRTINTTSCEPFTPGRLEQFLLWYIWFAITSIYIIVSLIFSIRALYKQFRMEGNQSQLSMQIQYRQALKEAMALLIIIAIFTVLIVVEFVAYLMAVYGSSRADSWVLDAVFNPLLFLLIPTAFFLHPATSKCLRCSELRKAAKRWQRRLQLDVNTTDSETNCIVPNEPEFSEECRLVIRGTSGYGCSPKYGALEAISNLQVPMAP